MMRSAGAKDMAACLRVWSTPSTLDSTLGPTTGTLGVPLEYSESPSHGPPYQDPERTLRVP
jgi:hypothetical protein